MKKIMVILICVVVISSCNNDGIRTGAVDDTARVSPPTDKRQDTMSLTDTSYNIGDSLK